MVIKDIRRIVFLLICFFFFYTAGRAIQVHKISLSRQFPAQNIGKIKIQTLFEDVKVIAGPDDMIYLDYYGKVATSRNAEEILSISLEENLLSLESDWSGDDRNWSLFSPGTSNVVNLDIQVPAKLLESLDIESTSGDVMLSDISTDNTRLKTTSGDVGVSGLNLKSSLSIDVVSGDLRLSNISTNNTKLKTISGDVNGMSIHNEGASFMRTVSGDIDVAFKDPGLKITGRTTSGNISLRLPADQGFTLMANTISGSIENSFSSLRNASRVDESVGEGAPPGINLETVSGDVKIHH